MKPVVFSVRTNYGVYSTIPTTSRAIAKLDGQELLREIAALGMKVIRFGIHPVEDTPSVFDCRCKNCNFEHC